MDEDCTKGSTDSEDEMGCRTETQGDEELDQSHDQVVGEGLRVPGLHRNAQDASASDVVDYLILKTEPHEVHIANIDWLPVGEVEDLGPPITNEDVQGILDEEFMYPRPI